MSSAEIRQSLFGATDAAGLTDAIALQLVDIFSSDIDFHRDLRKFDRFSLVYEMFFSRGEPVRSGRVLAAEFTNQGNTYRAVWFEYAPDQGGYYTFDGRSLRKQFLRSPLEFSRISSGYSSARYHPLLREWRAHKGIDYAAPTGTRIRAIADGTVDFAGRQGGYGNLIVLRHQTQYTTWYGHLSGFAKALRSGSRVHQGEIIGYVGATGLATGPHLHYEFRVNNVQKNPLNIAMPAAPPITADQRPRFAEATRAFDDQLVLLRTTNLARLD
jgi:murein DD-endopeptidase MepM/ murein hydrolase activator NlpD